MPAPTFLEAIEMSGREREAVSGAGSSRHELLQGGAALVSGLALAGPAGAVLAGKPAGRGEEAYRVRVAAAAFQRTQSWSGQDANGDEPRG